GSPPFVSMCTSVSMSPMRSTLRSSSFASFISSLIFSISISSPLHDTFNLSSQQPSVGLEIIVDFKISARMDFHDLSFIQFCRFAYSNVLIPEGIPLPLLHKFRYITKRHRGNTGVAAGGLPVIQQDDRFAVLRNLDAAELCRFTEHVVSARSEERRVGRECGCL